ncbi:MAG: hypothetical protein APR53_09650 [Methanoculleus sp. SDB]|nr:MAG: hypothetical protein APR53_09650 [Methanoculleus sp. SDB]
MGLCSECGTIFSETLKSCPVCRKKTAGGTEASSPAGAPDTCAESIDSARPMDIRGEIALKRYRDIDYFAFSGFGLFIFAFLFLVTDNFLLFVAAVICFFSCGIFGLFTLVGGYHNQQLYRNITRLLFTRTGIYLQDHKGKIKCKIPFSHVTAIKYGYKEHVISAVLDLGARVPLFVRFDLTGNKKFIIPMHFITRADQRKIFSLLPAFNG